eukprot:CAMPEP_0194513864 /NCGR_PEP_ID=MMETSP0253-20130528/46151_1 /TAXON_ID=2966 /ORGANISM="Noctiluca scintillans" /LENGTH=504 /DNA_ID=CAMNT_0039357447 /DNA_START=122 /DNA_END=1636 /DNA_ORIENTATION=-
MGKGGAEFLGYEADVASLLDDGRLDVVVAACQALGAMEDVGARYADALGVVLSRGSEKKQVAALDALGAMGSPVSYLANKVVSSLQDGNANVRAAACLALGSMGADEYVQELCKCLGDDVPKVVSSAITGLSYTSSGKSYASEVGAKLGAPQRDVKIAAVDFFALHKDLVAEQAESIGALLGDSCAMVRKSAVSVFLSMQEEASALVPSAVRVLKNSPDVLCKGAAAFALGSIGGKAKDQAREIAKLLEETLEDKSQAPDLAAGIQSRLPAELRFPACAAISALAKLDGEKYASDFVGLLDSNSMEIQIAALTALGDIGAKADAVVSSLLQAPEALVRASACSALGKMAKLNGADPEIVASVADCLVDRSPLVKASAAEALGFMEDEGAAYTEAILHNFQERSVLARVAAISAMGTLGIKGQMYASEVCRLMYDDHPEVRIAAARSLSRMGARGASFADEVSSLLDDPLEEVRDGAVKALTAMGDDGKPFLAQDPAQNISALGW